MALTARNSAKEYWRPVSLSAAELAATRIAEVTCPNCGIEYAVRARFCYVCGTERDSGLPHPTGQTVFELLRRQLSLPSLICVMLALLCVGAAMVVGLLYKTPTLLEWQAVQLWRIDWLLGAVVSLLGALVFKKRSR